MAQASPFSQMALVLPIPEAGSPNHLHPTALYSVEIQVFTPLALLITSVSPEQEKSTLCQC